MSTTQPDSPDSRRRADSGGHAIDVHSLNKHFGDKHVVGDLPIQVARGEIFGFLGPNGNGKTTSIRMMCGLLTPDSGNSSCLGYDTLKQSAQIKRRVGYMTQRFSCWDDLSVHENLDFVVRLYKMSSRHKAVDRALEHLGLTSRAKQLVGPLSGGWKQRLVLVACIPYKLGLLLLDGPTAGVDPKARRDFWEELHRLAAEGILMLVSTHYMNEAEHYYKLTYIAYGELSAQGTADEMIAAQYLPTWSVSGGNLVKLGHKLEGQPGADQTVAFGLMLYVTGVDARALEGTLRKLAGESGMRAEPIDAGLEDVFTHMMKHSSDNYGTQP